MPKLSPVPIYFNFAKIGAGEEERLIFHITTQTEWETAKANGVYVASSLACEGFIHCSKKEQILDTANNFFHGQQDLLLLCIAPEKLQSTLKYEAPSETLSTHTVGVFPHVYGPINLAAVVRTAAFPCNRAGQFALPTALD